MKPFLNRILVCVLPILAALVVVVMAWRQYERGDGGFKLGVDLVGGTILVYEEDTDKYAEEEAASKQDASKTKKSKGDEMAAMLKRRIDPADLYNVTIRPLGDTRVEIILPTGGAHQAEAEEKRWNAFAEGVREQWPILKDDPLEQGHSLPASQLAGYIQQEIEKSAWDKLIKQVTDKWPTQAKEAKLDLLEVGKKIELREALKKAGVNVDDDKAKGFLDDAVKAYEGSLIKSDAANTYVNAHYRQNNKKKAFIGDMDRIKELITQVGSLEFRILANARDDKEAVDAARAFFDSMNDPKEPEQKRNERKEDLLRRAERGLPPPPPKNAEGGPVFRWASDEGKEGTTTYSWVQLGRQERKSLDLDNAAKDEPGRSVRWNAAARARDEQKALVLTDNGDSLLFSRRSVSRKEDPQVRAEKQYEYFLLTRDPKPGDAITGSYLVNARSDLDQRGMKPAVHFKFDNKGGNLFYDLTSANRPSGAGQSPFYRHLAIILNGEIESAPRLNEAIRTDGQISGNFTKNEVDNLVDILRSGALPAKLKKLPVSENTIGPTLGSDTIKAGLTSVMIAFVAILLFMLVYYQFSGMVACVALFANLLLTVAFMVLVNATFTLPGLAGLVLMLGMAVDANVLIYERLREERDKGASLSLAIRNGYDRAFPTIIDTHLSSIFTAIVLYAVGNDQLKGFGVSLTVGLIISLFTSLYMTRLMFDIWLAKGWLKKLNMFRLLSNTNIDFMRIRYYWFTATIILTIFGATVFLIRGSSGLNIDFVGGTLYTGQLKEGAALNITQLRELLGEKQQEKVLNVVKVQQLDAGGFTYQITYKDPDGKETTQTIKLTNPPLGPQATKEQREADVKQRAMTLPDLSVEQIFLSTENTGNKSRIFNIRTSEKAPDLVQVSLDRLLTAHSDWLAEQAKDGEPIPVAAGESLLKKITLNSFETQAQKADLTFSEPAFPSQVKMLLEREAEALNVPNTMTFDVSGEGKGTQNRYGKMRLDVTGPDAAKVVPEAKLKEILAATQKAFAARPQPERLENFDKQLASDTQTSAMYAILLSWAAILLYLWFRFGNWTFGAATVICLIHDLFFTLGIIAFSHYIHNWVPGLATLLGLQDFKLDLPSVAALLTLVGYSVNDTIVVFDRIREVRGKNPELTPEMINASVNQTLSRTLLTSFSVWLVVIVLYIWGGEGVHLFAFVMVVGVIVGTYSSIYIASPLLLIFGEGATPPGGSLPEPKPEPEEEVPA